MPHDTLPRFPSSSALLFPFLEKMRRLCRLRNPHGSSPHPSRIYWQELISALQGLSPVGSGKGEDQDVVVFGREPVTTKCRGIWN